jgi:hypothetical protein
MPSDAEDRHSRRRLRQADVDAIEALDKSAVSDAAHTLSEMEVNLVLVAPEGGASGTDTMKEAPVRPGAS